MFKVGRVYQRQRIHDLFGGERQKGISQPSGHDVILLFSHNGGELFGLGDGWIDGETFQYLGEGSTGDQTFSRGNQAIRDHVELGKSLLLFTKVAPKMVRFDGEMIYAGHDLIPNAPDAAGLSRTVIAIRLKRRTTADATERASES